MKWKLPSWITPPSWQTLRVVNIVTCVGCTLLALIADNRWLALADAFLAGTTFAAAINATMMITMRRAFDGAVEAFNEMREINEALVHNRIEIHFREMHHDDAPPISPSLH